MKNTTLARGAARLLAELEAQLPALALAAVPEHRPGGLKAAAEVLAQAQSTPGA